MYFFLAFAACSANHAKSFFPSRESIPSDAPTWKGDTDFFPSLAQRCWKSREGGKNAFLRPFAAVFRFCSGKERECSNKIAVP